MKVLITGATGLVGQRLVWKLIHEGVNEIRILTRKKGKAQDLFPFPIKEFIWSDPANDPVPVEALMGVDGIFHLAGENVASGRWTRKRKKSIYESRVKSTENIFRSINELKDDGPKVFVSSSAVGIYGNRGEEDIFESSSLGSGFLAGVCRDWEDAAFKNNQKKLRIVHLRTGIVLSHEGGALRKMLPAFLLGGGGPLGNGKQIMSWIHIDDLVNQYIWALKNDYVQGPINGTAPEPQTNLQFSKTLGKVLKRPVIFPVPSFMLKFIFGEMSTILLEGQKVLPYQSETQGFAFQYPKLEGALEDLLKSYTKKEFYLTQAQWVADDLESTFDFFSKAENLQKLTPSELQFRIVKKSTPEIQKGTLIDYALKVKGIPLTWRSEITNWEPGKEFTDIQLKGPYKKWHHVHKFLPFQGGTLVLDKIDYKVPGGIFGPPFVLPFVKRDLRKIFNFRREQIEKLFPGRTG